MTQRPVDPDGPDELPLGIDAHSEALRPVARRGRGPTIAATLIVLAFLVGVLRPWDLLGPAAPEVVRAPAEVAADNPAATGEAAVASPMPAASTGPLTVDQAAAQVCGYPQGWRSATIQHWAGRRAHVWTAVDVVEATGPTDPAIPFQVVAGDDFTAIGWCAPVEGDERPPVSATGRLFALGEDGVATELPYRRIDPAVPSALGELWSPAEGGGSGDAAWPVGRYVIALQTESGTWERWLGLDLRAAPVPAGAPGGASPSSTSPSASAPSASAGASSSP